MFFTACNKQEKIGYCIKDDESLPVVDYVRRASLLDGVCERDVDIINPGTIHQRTKYNDFNCYMDHYCDPKYSLREDRKKNMCGWDGKWQEKLIVPDITDISKRKYEYQCPKCKSSE